MLCVLVMGGPRAGTSLCAGIIHNLGVHMGDDLGDVNDWNPLGFYEDGEFSDIYSRMCFGDGTGSIDAYMPVSASLGGLSEIHSNAIARRCHRSWGVKSARLCYVLKDFISACPLPIKVIRMDRNENEMVASWQARSGVSVSVAKATIGNAKAATEKAINECRPSVLTIRFDDLVNNPTTAVKSISMFLDVPYNKSALKLVEPSLRRYSL